VKQFKVSLAIDSSFLGKRLNAMGKANLQIVSKND